MKIRMLLRFRAYDKNNNSIGFCALPFGDYRDYQMTLADLASEISQSINLIKESGFETFKYRIPWEQKSYQSFRYKGLKLRKPEQVEKATHLEFKTAFEYWDEKNKTWYFLTSKSNKIKFDKDIVNYKKVWYLEAN